MLTLKVTVHTVCRSSMEKSEEMSAKKKQALGFTKPVDIQTSRVCTSEMYGGELMS